MHNCEECYWKEHDKDEKYARCKSCKDYSEFVKDEGPCTVSCNECRFIDECEDI